MMQKKLLIANRGEVALRIARTAQDMGLETISIFTEDDHNSLHCRRADRALALSGRGVAGYLNAEEILNLATNESADLIHPGWGFLSENAEFATECEARGINFVGPTASQLKVFGDKVAARTLAGECKVPTLEASKVLSSAKQLKDFYQQLGVDVIVKAVAGGGGRGMQLLQQPKDVDTVFQHCSREAQLAFGCGELYAERYLPRARHIEIQVVGDGSGAVTHLWDRDCSIQRSYQKLIEVAPSPYLNEGLRERLIDSALAMAKKVHYRGVGTFEFLVDEENQAYFFIEANPRLQVEHTITEAITGFDLVSLQLAIAQGSTLADLGLAVLPRPPLGMAMQLRINGEQMRVAGEVLPTGGEITLFEPAIGPGVRVDSALTLGSLFNPAYDSLAAKLIVHLPKECFKSLLNKASRAIKEFSLAGIETNIPFLQAILEHPSFVGGSIHNRFVEQHYGELYTSAEGFKHSRQPGVQVQLGTVATASVEGALPILAAMSGSVVDVLVAEGDVVKRGDTLVVTEAMKMHHLVTAPAPGVVCALHCRLGEIVSQDMPLLFIKSDEQAEVEQEVVELIDLNSSRKDLDEVVARHALTLDENRPQAVAKRRKTGSRTARENVEDLCDEESFIEYGALAIGAQRRRRDIDELMVNSPADGMIAGFGTVNAPIFGEESSRCAILAYDYTVMAGTQGVFNHKKKDRLFELIEEWQVPTVFFTEGGGGRPGEVDQDDLVMGWLDLKTFTTWPQCSGVAPRIGINHGRCFAGNAAIFGLCDITVATRSSNIGLAGPAMIEGGGLGKYSPEEIGPMEIQSRNGVVDVLCGNEAEATAIGRQLLSYFQGDLPQWQCDDQRLLRHLIPENRMLAYDIRKLINVLADQGSVIELRPDFAPGMVTALIRIEGKPFGVIANNPNHLGGAVDNEGCDSASRFLQLCDSFNLPVVSLCDTPGFMVGPESEQAAAVRRGSQLILASANLRVPLFSVALRKAYGLGAQAMVGGSFHRPFLSVAWPTAEFGPMGFEGAVTLGYKKELDAISDPTERERLFHRLVDGMYLKGKGVSVAQVCEVDAVIDPADTRQWILRGLKTAGKRRQPRRSYLNVW